MATRRRLAILSNDHGPRRVLHMKKPCRGVATLCSFNFSFWIPARRNSMAIEQLLSLVNTSPWLDALGHRKSIHSPALFCTTRTRLTRAPRRPRRPSRQASGRDGSVRCGARSGKPTALEDEYQQRITALLGAYGTTRQDTDGQVCTFRINETTILYQVDST